MYICIHVCRYVCMYACMCMYVCVCMCVCVCVCVYVCVYVAAAAQALTETAVYGVSLRQLTQTECLWGAFSGGFKQPAWLSLW